MHQTIGIVGGLSPESTASYYQLIVREHYQHFGDRYYPAIAIKSVNYQQYTDWRLNHQWDVIAEQLTAEFTALARAGADFGLIACNTMHKVLPQVQSPIPVLSIVDAAALEAKRLGLDTLVLTGTRFTMEDGFLSQQLSALGMPVVVPDAAGQGVIEHIIRTELTLGTVLPESAAAFAKAVVDTMQRENLPSSKQCGLLLACTELGLLAPYLPPELTCLDTARLHAIAAWKIATGQQPLAAEADSR